VPKAVQGLRRHCAQEHLRAAVEGEARQALRKAVELLQPKYPAAAVVVEQTEEDVLAYYGFPEKRRRQIHSTNPH
jgi:transposase-like protein